MKIKLMIKELWMEHKLGVSIGISALLQFCFIFFTTFSSGGGDLDRRFMPMTILPFVETYEEQEVIKQVEETEDSTEASEENQNMKQSMAKTVSQGDPSNFLSFVRVDEVAKPTQSLMPQYPEMARSANIEGTVVLEVYIDEGGMVRKINLVKGIGFGCEEAAIARVKNTTFIPAKMNGNPVAVRQIISFEFKLR